MLRTILNFSYILWIFWNFLALNFPKIDEIFYEKSCEPPAIVILICKSRQELENRGPIWIIAGILHESWWKITLHGGRVLVAVNVKN